MYGYGYKYTSGLVVGAGGTPLDTTFKITVDTTKAGSASDTFVLPLQIATTNMTIYWGDGNSDLITAYNQAELTHVYSVGGIYQITLDGPFGGVKYRNLGDKLKISSIDNWGSNVWSSMKWAFWGCSNMVANYSDSPDTSLVLDMSNAFHTCTNFNGSVDFNTSSATSMTYMFYNCTNFNQPVNFNTTSVSNVILMFGSCTNFNQPITFNLPNCTSLYLMFSSCTLLNEAINITTSSLLVTCTSMLKLCTSLNSLVTISNTSSVTTMQSMFQQCTVFDQDISSFDISSLTNATNMMLASGFSVTNYDLLLVSWQGKTHNNSVNLHAGTAKYNAGAPATARAGLITDSWTITDGGAV